MTRSLRQIFDALLDRTGSLGAGVVDFSGLAVHTSGLHGGLDPQAIAAHLPCLHGGFFAALLEDTLVEDVLIGERYSFYLRRLSGHTFFMYIMTEDKTSGGTLRYALRHSEEAVVKALCLTETALSAATNERLEQPREFLSERLVR